MWNLVVAAGWGVVGGGLLLWAWLHPEAPGLMIRGTRVSAGWLFLVLALYNVVRWWAGRARRATQQLLDQARPPRERRPLPREVDSAFDFEGPAPREGPDPPPTG